MEALASTVGCAGGDGLSRLFVLADNQQRSRTLTDLIEEFGEPLSGLLDVGFALVGTMRHRLGTA